MGFGLGGDSSGVSPPRDCANTVSGHSFQKRGAGAHFGETLTEREEGRETHGAHDVVRREVLLGNIEWRIVLKMPARGECLVGQAGMSQNIGAAPVVVRHGQGSELRLPTQKTPRHNHNPCRELRGVVCRGQLVYLHGRMQKSHLFSPISLRRMSTNAALSNSMVSAFSQASFPSITFSSR